MPRDIHWIRSASDDELKYELIDPWLLDLIQTREAFVAAPREVRAIVCLWTLQAQTCRNGLVAFVAEEPPWISGFVEEAARLLDMPSIAARWRAVIEGMDLAAQHGRMTDEVEWGNAAAAEAFQAELVHMDPVDVDTHVLGWIRAHAESLATAT